MDKGIRKGVSTGPMDFFSFPPMVLSFPLSQLSFLSTQNSSGNNSMENNGRHPSASPSKPQLQHRRAFADKEL